MILSLLQGDQEPGSAGMKEALLVPPRKRFGVRTGLVDDADRKPKVTSLRTHPIPATLTLKSLAHTGSRQAQAKSIICMLVGILRQ